MASEDPIIIIGSGLAGYNVAREFRKLNADKELIIIADDEADFYSKPMLSNALVNNKSAQDLPIANMEKMAADLNANILKHTRVEKIDQFSKGTMQLCRAVAESDGLTITGGGDSNAAIKKAGP